LQPIKDSTSKELIMDLKLKNEFLEIMKMNGVIQPSVLFKIHILIYAFDEDPLLLSEFIEQIKESYNYKKLSPNKATQSSYLTTVLFNEIKNLEEIFGVS
jgi:hypothetical protein